MMPKAPGPKELALIRPYQDRLAAAEAEAARLAAEVNRLQALLPDECAYPDTPGKIIARLAALLTQAERERDENLALAAGWQDRYWERVEVCGKRCHHKLRALIAEAREALREWKCPSCHGAKEGAFIDPGYGNPAYYQFPCATCRGDGLDRRARALLARLTPQAPTPEESETP